MTVGRVGPAATNLPSSWLMTLGVAPPLSLDVLFARDPQGTASQLASEKSVLEAGLRRLVTEPLGPEVLDAVVCELREPLRHVMIGGAVSYVGSSDRTAWRGDDLVREEQRLREYVGREERARETLRAVTEQLRDLYTWVQRVWIARCAEYATLGRPRDRSAPIEPPRDHFLRGAVAVLAARECVRLDGGVARAHDLLQMALRDLNAFRSALAAVGEATV